MLFSRLTCPPDPKCLYRRPRGRLDVL